MAFKSALSFDQRFVDLISGKRGDNIVRWIRENLGVEIDVNFGTVVASAENEKDLNNAINTMRNLEDDVIQGRKSISVQDIANAVREDSDPGRFGSETIVTQKRRARAKSSVQDEMIRSIRKNAITFAVGPAGTGKTWLAVGLAVAALESGEVDRIVFSRPAVEAGERIGFLPGDMKEKVDPYLRPIYDALYDFMDPKIVEKRLIDKTIEIAPLAFMRGRTLAKSFVVLDEGQNATRSQTKMFLTRIGEGSIMVLCGDASQTDIPGESGFSHAANILEGDCEVGVVKFSSCDVVRRDVVTRIVEAYERE